MDELVEEPEDVDEPPEPPVDAPAVDGFEAVEPEPEPSPEEADEVVDVVEEVVVDFPEPRESVR